MNTPNSDPRTYVPARDRTGTFGHFQLHPTHLVTGVTRSSDGATILTGTATVSPELARAAALQVCAHAVDAAEARRFLKTLGLAVTS